VKDLEIALDNRPGALADGKGVAHLLSDAARDLNGVTN
jgi:hypothetical protein